MTLAQRIEVAALLDKFLTWQKMAAKNEAPGFLAAADVAWIAQVTAQLRNLLFATNAA